ncbi:MAG: tRNA (cytidine(34)-2'-O)-methyltransferase [Kiritimatiellae bacterium]|nr:tRNA (cytidine(34)-2'-O)-methyltransferase [Kiritimatiellia bacterium]
MNTAEFKWPKKPFHIALVEPEIPPNTGNIARLCAATGSRLHLVGQLGFALTDRELKRAGLDYWESVDMVRHDDFKSFMSALSPARFFFFSARGGKNYLSVKYRAGDVLVFGGESRGLPDEILKTYADNLLAIPIKTKNVRSLNLATAVGIVLYEALRHVSVDLKPD